MSTALAPNIAQTANANHALRRRSKQHYEKIVPEIRAMLAADMSLSRIARNLNSRGFTNSRGKQFSRALVHYTAKQHGLIVT